MCEAAASEKKKIMPSNKVQLLQDPFLNMLRKEHIPVSIYLVNGIKLQGQIESFDQYVVILRNTLTQMVYKHAISTVVPSRAVSMTAQPAGDATETDLSKFQLDETHAKKAFACVSSRCFRWPGFLSGLRRGIEAARILGRT